MRGARQPRRRNRFRQGGGVRRRGLALPALAVSAGGAARPPAPRTCLRGPTSGVHQHNAIRRHIGRVQGPHEELIVRSAHGVWEHGVGL